ncbi:MAG: hypothetical protein JWQ70_3172 [Aeromicrobium sp.]|nr:hypothetical protein [Aeromicrobium sp.]
MTASARSEQTDEQRAHARRVHPWHRVNLSINDRRLLRVVEQRLAHQHPDVPTGRIIRMVYGTARLLRAAGPVHEQLAAQVEAACHEALVQDTTMPFA